MSHGIQGAVGSVFGAKAEVSPAGNKKPAFGAEMLAGTTGTGKVGGSKAWELPVGVAKGWRIGLSKGLQTAVPGLELKKSGLTLHSGIGATGCFQLTLWEEP